MNCNVLPVQTMLWAGYCARGCCTRAKVALFQIILFYWQSNRKISDTDNCKNDKYRP